MKKQGIALVTVASLLWTAGCASTDENKKAKMGAGIGAAAGAAVGAIIGHQTGKRNEGALIGAALGGAIGAHAGHRMDQQAKELEKLAETKRTERGLVTKLKSDILFDTGKADLKPGAQKNLKEMAEIMTKYPENVLVIQGYTDSTGTDKTNQELSKKRAEAVRTALISYGMPAATMTTEGLGPSNPVADNKTPDGRMKNRRVEIQVTVDESKIPPEKKS